MTNRVQIKETYLQCLDTNKQQAEKCTGVAKAYLECRMDKCAPPAPTWDYIPAVPACRTHHRGIPAVHTVN